MNILIPHSWLLEHLETSAKPADIQKYLSLSGPSVERIYETTGEPVYDIEVTTNRVDCMSVRGIAREAAVILTQAGIKAKLKPLTKLPSFMTKATGKKSGSFSLPKIIAKPSLISRIMCMLLSHVTPTSSPEWMQIRLKQIGVNAHDAVIDITNYVTHDLGHPCHAFDYDKLMELGGSIRIVQASKGKKITTLDGETHTTLGGEVVFENDKGEIIDLPGVKGTINSGISSGTKNVLFWIESVEPSLIRFASMSHAIRTVAAQLNEKGVDPELIPPTFAKGVELLSTLAGAKPQPSTYLDLYPKKRRLSSVNVSMERIEEYLGLKVEINLVTKILKDLGCEVTVTGKTVKVHPPSWRPDIVIPEDVIEEIARIYGYHNLPSVLMSGAIPISHQADVNFTLEHASKILLAALGGNEVYTYSLIDEKTVQLESKFVTESHLKLKNPLTEDMVYLRRTIWASHLGILTKQSPQFVFELANTYIPSSSDTLPTEELHLTLSSLRDERHLKGVLDALLTSMYLPPVRYEINQTGQGTTIKSADAILGQILSLPEFKLTVIDLNWKTLVGIAQKYPQVKAIPKVSAIIEDMTFAFSSKVLVQDILTCVKNIDPLIDRVEFKDIFKTNITFTVYYQPEDEMSTSDIAPYRKKISEVLAGSFGATIVGKL